jgi:hypothetical protein
VEGARFSDLEKRIIREFLELLAFLALSAVCLAALLVVGWADFTGASRRTALWEALKGNSVFPWVSAILMGWVVAEVLSG